MFFFMFLFMTFYQCFFIMFLNKCIEKTFYHLLCAFSFYFSMNALRKLLSFTMCFLILFLDERTEKISIIYYVLSHSISWFSLKTCMSSTRSYWENLYHLLCAFSFYFLMNALKKSLSFTMCFFIEFILFFDERIIIKKLSIILYVLSHHVLQWTHWENLYYLVDASSSYFSTSVLRKSLLFNRCFFIIFFDERIKER